LQELNNAKFLQNRTGRINYVYQLHLYATWRPWQSLNARPFKKFKR